MNDQRLKQCKSTCESSLMASTDDNVNKDGRKKKPWQWAVDALVWTICVVALVLVLLYAHDSLLSLAHDLY